MIYLYLAACLLLCIFIFYLIYSNAKQNVIEHSVALKRLVELSQKFSFYDIEQIHIHTKHQSSLAAFRRFNYENELLLYIRANQFYFEEQLKNAKENLKNYKDYHKEFQHIRNTQQTEWNSKFQYRIENKLLDKQLLTPTCTLQIKIENKYTSPKGRNSYYDHRLFLQNQIEEAFVKIEHQNTFQAQKQEERSKMSDSLRYDILKRDGFKCTICGASAQDGAKLHVDHILPVSKGGKTTKNNLRTLCSNCNLGKSDKYDPFGIN